MSVETNSQGEREAPAPKGSYDYLKALYDKEIAIPGNPRIHKYGDHLVVEIKNGNVEVIIASEPVCEIGGACMDLTIAQRIEVAKTEIIHMHVTKDDRALDLSTEENTPLSGFVEIDKIPNPAFMVHLVRKTNRSKA